MELFGLLNYWLVVVLMMIGFYIVIAQGNLVKKMVGLSIFQVSVFVFYISIGRVDGGTAPILGDGLEVFSNPLPHVRRRQPTKHRPDPAVRMGGRACSLIEQVFEHHEDECPLVVTDKSIWP